MQLHDKLGIPKTFFQRPEIIAREQQITAAFQLVAELQALAATAVAADEARAAQEHREKRKDEAKPDEGEPVDAKGLEKLMVAALGEDMAIDGGVGAPARERVEQRRAAFREKLAAQLAKRRRRGRLEAVRRS